MKYQVKFDFTTTTPKGFFKGKSGTIDMNTDESLEQLDMKVLEDAILVEMQKRYKRDVVVLVNVKEIIEV